MIVVPESMMVSKLLEVVLEPAIAFAPVACQKPVEVSILWNSTEPLYLEVSVPPKKSSDPVDASLKPKEPALATSCDIAVLKKGFCSRIYLQRTVRYVIKQQQTWSRLEMAGQARPRIPSAGSSANSLESVVTGEKYWFFTVRPPTVTRGTISICTSLLSGTHQCRYR